MRLTSNRNILPCYCSFVDEDRLYLITQLMDKGSCQRVIQLCRENGIVDEVGGFSEVSIAYILSELVNGLAYIHSQGLIHRDIKAGIS